MPRPAVLSWGMTEHRHLDIEAVALQGIVEHLVREVPRDAAAAPGSGIAGSGPALAAVAELARAVEVPAQAGDLDPEQAHRMLSLLLVVRDFVAPLDPGADEHVARYLAEVVRRLPS
jgi:hypothetical protein